MSCNNYTSIDRNVNHCGRFSPFNGGNFNQQGGFQAISWQGVPVQHERYASAPFLQERLNNKLNINVPGDDNDMVMYPSTIIETDNNYVLGGSSGGRGTACGNAAKYIDSGSDGDIYSILGHYPDRLSFKPLSSDEWFFYLFDTSDPVVGYPCYFLEDVDEVTTTTIPGNGLAEDDPNYDPGSSSSSTVSGNVCHPCTSLNCTAGSTNVEYTTQDGRIVEGRDPFPTLWTAGTTSNSIAFRYQGGLPTSNPISATEFDISGAGLTQTDAWDSAMSEGIDLTISDNPWADPEDIGFESIYVTDDGALNIGTAKTGLQVKIRYSPSTTVSGNTETITGTIVRLDEVVSPGVGYQVGDTFTITIPVNSGNISFTLHITGTGEVESSNPYTNYALVNAGDTVNGHEVLSVKHMDLNFNWHVLNIDGNGNDFVYDQVYTTNRGNQIKVKAGNGIADKGFIGGLYEFRNKSFQYMTADMNKQPNNLDDYRQPTARKKIKVNFSSASNTVTLKNGSDSTFVRAGYTVTSPSIPNNTYITNVNGSTVTLSNPSATVTGPAYEGEIIVTMIEIINGQIQDIQIADGGANWNKLNTLPKLELITATEPAGKPAVIDFSFVSGVLTSVSVKTRGSGYAQGSQIDIAVPKTMKARENIAWPSSDPKLDQSNAISDAVYGLPELQNAEQEGKFIEIDTATEYGKTPIDYNYEGGEIDTYEKFQLIIQRAANDKPRKKGDSRGLRHLRFKTTLRPRDLRAGMKKHQYEEFRFDNPTNEINDLKRVKGVLRTERLERALPDREDFDDLQWKTLDDRLSEPFAGVSPGAEKFIRQLVENDKIRKDEFIDLNSEAPEVTASGVKLAKYDREEVRTVRGSAFDLPCASQFTKYLLRQYKPDSRQTSSITITLNWEPANPSSCADSTGCATNFPYSNPGSSSGNTTIVYNSLGLDGPFGEGCRAFSATGSAVIRNDLTNGTIIYSKAVEARGNPYDFKCT